MSPFMPEFDIEAPAKGVRVLSCFSRSGSRCVLLLLSYPTVWFPLWAVGDLCEMRGWTSVKLLGTWGPEITLWFLLPPS